MQGVKSVQETLWSVSGWLYRQLTGIYELATHLQT
jgi:hypothetical protein